MGGQLEEDNFLKKGSVVGKTDNELGFGKGF